MISKTEKFTPRLFRDTSIFEVSFEEYKETTGGYLDLVSFSKGSRRDISEHYIEYYYHHLATNSCYIGFGITDLGYIKDDYYKLFPDYAGPSGVIEVTNENRNNFMKNRKLISKNTPNVFSIFIEDDINIFKLLSSELDYGMVLTHLEYDRLNE